MKVRKKPKFLNLYNTFPDYLLGYCDIFARAANRRFKHPMYGYFENRVHTLKGRLVTRRGLVHAFLCIDKTPSDNWLVFDAKGLRRLKDIHLDYAIDELKWIDPLSSKELLALSYTSFGVEQTIFDKKLMRQAKGYIRKRFNNKRFSTNK